jgi:hypothetical protein
MTAVPRRPFIPLADRLKKPVAAPIQWATLVLALAGLSLSIFNTATSLLAKSGEARVALLHEAYLQSSHQTELMLTMEDTVEQVKRRLALPLPSDIRARDEKKLDRYKNLLHNQKFWDKNARVLIDQLKSLKWWQWDSTGMSELLVKYQAGRENDANMEKAYRSWLNSEYEETQRVEAELKKPTLPPPSVQPSVKKRVDVKSSAPTQSEAGVSSMATDQEKMRAPTTDR